MADQLTTRLTHARQELIEARAIVNTEIRSYPTPISGCDAQFNHLLGERQKILNALSALEDVVFVPTPRTPMRQSGIESR